MQILIASVAVAVVAFQTSPLRPRLTPTDPLLVRSVVDGDTIVVATFGRVRLLGIDAPEIGRGFDTAAPFAHEARERLASLVLHCWVRLQRDGTAIDAYNRHLAYVLLEDGLFVNAALVRDGLARVSARTPLARLNELQHAEADAKAFRRGMWGATPQIPATGYTRRLNGGRARSAKPKKPPTQRPRAPRNHKT